MNYVLPHKLDRPGQQEAIDNMLDSDKPYQLADAETGSGKSAWVAHASLTNRVMVLTKSKVLQADNYLKGYNFDVLYGKGNYKCGTNSTIKADLCISENGCFGKYFDYHHHKKTCPCFSELSNFSDTDCENGRNCAYHQARKDAVNSDRLSLNIAKFIVDPKLTEDHGPDIIFIDEAHLIPNEVIDNSGFSFDWENEYWTIKPQEFHGVHTDVKQLAIAIRNSMSNQHFNNAPVAKIEHYGEIIKNPEYLKWERIGNKLDLLVGDITDYFFEGTVDEFICKPLTAKHRFKYMFEKAFKIVMMSATIGNPEILANSLGIAHDEYNYIKVNSLFKSVDRPIHLLNGPKLAWPYSEDQKAKHAYVIAEAINKLPERYQGILHVTSYASAKDLSYRLRQYGISSYVPVQGDGTERQLTQWKRQQARGVKAFISPNHWEGVDLGDLNFSIVCKIPWGYVGDNYSKALRDFDRPMYAQKAAWKVMQAIGRVLRGFAHHYGPNAEKYVAIVDPSVTGLMSYFSPFFKESFIRERRTPIRLPKKGNSIKLRF